ncbi:hypothetical protein ABZ747_17830 [Kitasatospora cineracea]
MAVAVGRPALADTRAWLRRSWPRLAWVLGGPHLAAAVLHLELSG